MSLRLQLVFALWASVLIPTTVGVVGSWSALGNTRAFESVLSVLFVAAMLGGVFATLASLRFTPQIGAPIRAAMEAADRIAAGTRSVRIDTEAGGEAGRLVQAFNHMARELDAAESKLRKAERIAVWRDIARQMAHEIKNPLTPIQMGVEMLRKAKERQLPEFDLIFDEQTSIVLEEVNRLRRLVESFSRFARAPRPRAMPMDVHSVIEHVVSMHSHAEAEVTGEVEESVRSIRADREQVLQVLVNLVQNAVTAASERAQQHPDNTPAAVHVSARLDGTELLVIDVADNGGGIDPSIHSRVFEPYVTTRKGAGGTGLGLAIAWRIVHEHGGSLLFESSPEGTRFSVRLPVAGPQETDATQESDERAALSQ
jgi:nitrogen fixation/metabolism regulation signal transduction histidine kinase